MKWVESEFDTKTFHEIGFSPCLKEEDKEEERKKKQQQRDREKKREKERKRCNEIWYDTIGIMFPYIFIDVTIGLCIDDVVAYTDWLVK